MRGDWLFQRLRGPGEGATREAHRHPRRRSHRYFPTHRDNTDPTPRGCGARRPRDQSGTRTRAAAPLPPRARRRRDRPIFRSLFYFDLEEASGWTSRPPRPSQSDFETGGEEELDPRIRVILVHHPHNPTAKPFGSSEVRGIERLFAVTHRGILTRSYRLPWTGWVCTRPKAGHPGTRTGTSYRRGPGPAERVETDPEANFRRVAGNAPSRRTSITELAADASREATGANDVAVGKVDVSVAESGTA